MGWKNSESLWVQEMRRIVARQRRSRWLTGAGMVVCGAVGVALLTGYWQAVASSFGPLGGVLAMIGGGSLPLTFMFLMFFVAALLTRLDGLVTSVPEHDGRVCARCRRPLTDDVRCERCKLQYVLQELREYWELFALAPKSASQQMPRLIAAASARFHGKPLTRMGRTLTNPTALAGFMIIVLPAVYVITKFMFFRGSLLAQAISTLTSFVPALLAACGVFLIRQGRGIRRIGGDRQCPTCGYRQAPDGVNPDRCPECGVNWSGAGGALPGGPERRPNLVVTGCVLCTLGIATFVLPYLSLGLFTTRSTWLAKSLPTTSLIKQVVSESYSSMAEWAELKTRVLSDEQRRRLAVGLLDGRLDDDDILSISPDADEWLAATARAGGLPSDLLERYYDEKLDVSLVVPDRPVPVNSPFEVSLALRPRPASGRSARAAVSGRLCFGGYLVGDDEEPVGQRHTSAYIEVQTQMTAHDEQADPLLRAAAQRAARIGNDSDMNLPPYTTTITPTEVGLLTVRAVLWEIVGPWNNVVIVDIAWNEDGTPVIPDGAVWSKRVELSAVVEVVAG